MTSIVAQVRPERDARAGTFLATVAELGGVTQDDVLTLASMCDAQLDAGGWRSTLNNDGFPLQACVTTDDTIRRARLLVDPASTELDVALRLRRGLRALVEALDALPDPAVRYQFMRAVETCLPPASALSSLRSGALWIGLDLGGRGAAAYVTARWGHASARWPRALDWLARWAGPAVPAALAALPEVADLTSVGVEGRARAAPRAKLYFRLRRPCPLTALGVPFFLEEATSRFLRLALEEFALRRDGLVCSVSADLFSDRLRDGKIDVCAHCTPRSPGEWVRCLNRVARELQLANPALDEMLLASRLAPAFVGLGVGDRGARRLNVYLKPPRATPSAAAGRS